MKLLHVKKMLELLLRLFVPIIICIHPLLATGQNYPGNRKIDSLVHQLKNSRPDTSRVKLLLALSEGNLAKQELDSTEYDRIFGYLRSAVTLCDSLSLSFEPWKSKCLYLLGKTLLYANGVPEARSVFMQRIKNAHDAADKKREAAYWNSYASALMHANKKDSFQYEIELAYNNAINIYHTLKDPKSEIDTEMDLGWLYSVKPELDKAETVLIDILKKSEANGAYRLRDINYWLSVTNRYKGNYNKALGYALNAIDTTRNKADSIHQSEFYGQLALIYQDLGNPAESVVWYKQCIAKRELKPDYPRFALYRTYSLLIVQLIKSGSIKEAQETIRDLEQRRPPSTLAENAITSQGKAYCYDANNDYERAEKYYIQTVEMYDRSYKKLHMDDEIIMLARYDLADFYVRHQQFKKARPYVDILMSKPDAVSVTKKVDVQLLFFKVDSAYGNYLSAIKHFQQYKAFSDSIFTEKKNSELTQVQVQYETAVKDQEIGLLTKKGQLQQANLRQANITRNWIAASAGLLILLLGVGYNRYRFKQKVNKQLETQQVIINQKNISLLHLVNEKEWLIKEIHHRVKNNFHIVMGLLGTQAGYLKNDEALTAIRESQQRIHSMSLIHQKLYQSESLSSIDMPGYIHELVDSLKDSFDKGAAVQFHFDVDRISLDLSHVIPVGLILNEAITNAFKYAFPGNREGNIYISFTYKAADNTAELTIKDDGVGLPAAFNLNSQSSMGVNLMRGLSQDIDGSFIIQNDNGTTVKVIFTYNPDLTKDFTPSSTEQNFIA